MASLFLTIASEEIPARMQQGAGQDLQRLVMAALQEAGLEPRAPKAFWGPRHIAIEIGDMLSQQPDRDIEKRGPRIEAPEKAIEGFCQSVGMTKDELVQEDTGKGVFYFARKSEKRANSTKLIARHDTADLVQLSVASKAKDGAHHVVHGCAPCIRLPYCLMVR